MPKKDLPTYDQMMNPLLDAPRQLGGSGCLEELEGKVADLLPLTDDQMGMLHDSTKRHTGRRM